MIIILRCFILAYDFEAFVGNTGGYIGLFLGYALLQIPGILINIISWCGGYVFKRYKNNTQHRNKDGETLNYRKNKLFNLLPGVSITQSALTSKVDDKTAFDEFKNLIKQEVEAQLRKNSPSQ